MLVQDQVLAEGVHEDRAAVGDQLEVQPTPGRPVRRAAPAGVYGGEDAVLEGDHLQRPRLHRHLVGVKDPVGGGVDLGDLASEEPAHDVDEVHGMIHDRAAAGERGVHKPVAIFRRQLAAVGGVEAVHLAQVARQQLLAHGEEGRAEAHGEGGHQLHARVAAGAHDGCPIFDRGRQRLLTENVDARRRRLLHVRPVPRRLRTDDDAVGPRRQQAPIVVEIGDVEGARKVAAARAVVVGDAGQLHAG